MFLMCAFAMLGLGWMLLLPGLFTSVIENRTGFPAHVDYFYANPFTAEVRMRGLAIVNPTGFGNSDFVELRQFTAKADLFSLFGRSPVLDMTTIDVARITVVTNQQGTNNLDLIYRRLASPTDKKSKTGAKKAPASSPLQFLVHNLDVRVNEVVVQDERPGKTPEQVHKLAFQRSYREVTPATNFNTDLPPAVAAAGKNVGEMVSGDLKQLVTNATQPIDRKTYAWGDKRENASQGTVKLEERPKP
ncbi:MAG: hypothetical protein WC205_09865 [Opitutaceae bacterium]|jgi:hypothetical protein